MDHRTRRFFNVILVGLLSTTLSIFAEPVPQGQQAPAQTQVSQAPGTSAQTQPTTTTQGNESSAGAPSRELPDAPTPAQPVEQNQSEPSGQTQNPAQAPSGAAAAKAAEAKGAPAARPVGSAIAPAKQHERRSLLIKVGLVAGACVAVGSAVALSKASPSKPPGAP
jgi:hypothetical protein